jgi:7,8-dihydro-6-hydroxymethylpterin-pyrophosphokinase
MQKLAHARKFARIQKRPRTLDIDAIVFSRLCSPCRRRQVDNDVTTFDLFLIGRGVEQIPDYLDWGARGGSEFGGCSARQKLY